MWLLQAHHAFSSMPGKHDSCVRQVCPYVLASRLRASGSKTHRACPTFAMGRACRSTHLPHVYACMTSPPRAHICAVEGLDVVAAMVEALAVCSRCYRHGKNLCAVAGLAIYWAGYPRLATHHACLLFGSTARCITQGRLVMIMV